MLLTSTMNMNIILKQSTQIGLFQVYKHPIKIINEQQIFENEDMISICSGQADRRKIEISVPPQGYQSRRLRAGSDISVAET